MAESDKASALLGRADALIRKERSADDVPVLTEVVDHGAPARGPAIDRSTLEALARDIELEVLERLGPQVDILLEERLRKVLNELREALDSSVSAARDELTNTVRQKVHDTLAAAVAQALSHTKLE